MIQRHEVDRSTRFRRRRVPFAIVILVALTCAFAACGGGDTKPAATASAAVTVVGAVSPAPANDSDALAYYKKLESVIGKAESAVTTATANRAAVSEDAVKAYVDFEAGLRDLAPPPTAAKAHARLLDAVRMLVGFAKKYQANDAPTPDATAEAEVIPAISGFASACTELQSLAKSADPAINLRCEE